MRTKRFVQAKTTLVGLLASWLYRGMRDVGKDEVVMGWGGGCA